MRRASAGVVLALAASLAGGGEGAALSASVAAAFDGHFRAGCPVLFRAAISNDGSAVEGELDLVVEGIAWRRPLRLGARSTTAVDVLAAVHTSAARPRLVVRDGAGQVLLEGVTEPPLRERRDHQPLVVLVGEGEPVAERAKALGAEVVTAAADGLPSASAAYLSIDAVVVAGDGGQVPQAACRALSDSVRGGGRVAFALDPHAPVRTESLLAELGGCSGRPTAIEWLRAAAESRSLSLHGDVVSWRVGLGQAVAGTAPHAVLAAVLAEGRARPCDLGEAPELYGESPEPPWGRSARWRLAGATLGLLAAALVVALVLPKGWGRWRRAACIAGASALLAAIAWLLVLPVGRGVLEAAGISQSVKGEGEGRRCEVIWVEGTGRGRVSLDLGQAAAVVPLYYTAMEAGSWRDVVASRDAAGRWTLACDVRRGQRRCFLACWGWGSAGPALAQAAPEVLVRDGQFAPGPEAPVWRPLRQLRRWAKPQRAVLTWQARRASTPGRTYAASWAEAGVSRVEGAGLLARRTLPTLLWTERPETP